MSGNRPIAELLIEHGAGQTIFSAAMLGQLDVVKGFAAATPNLNQLRGPHGIPLINHARAGGAQATEVLKYLESLGNLPAAGGEPLSDADRASIVGRYVFGDRPRDVFIVDAEKNMLGITRMGGFEAKPHALRASWSSIQWARRTCASDSTRARTGRP